jgi:hypothetical protein
MSQEEDKVTKLNDFGDLFAFVISVLALIGAYNLIIVFYSHAYKYSDRAKKLFKKLSGLMQSIKMKKRRS